MSQQNVELVKQIYAAFFARDVPKILSLTSPRIEVEQSEEVPWGGTYRTHAGLQLFFAVLATHLDNKGLAIDRYLDAGDHVVAIGRTQGVVKSNGKPFDVPLAHVWEIRKGKAVRFRPYIDNPTMIACLGPSTEGGTAGVQAVAKSEPLKPRKPAAVKLKTVMDTFEMCPDEWRAYLNRKTGECHTITENDDALDELMESEEGTKDLAKAREIEDNPDVWIHLPTRFDFHEYEVMESFCEEQTDENLREVLETAIHGKGAFRRFKDVIHRRGIQDEWYKWREDAMREFLEAWLNANDIPYE